MEEKIESDLLRIFTQSVSNNFGDIKESESKISALYNDTNRENYIRLLLKFIIYPYEEKNEKKNLYDNLLNKNVKIGILISIKNFIKKSVHSNLEDLELSPDLCIQIKHICLHILLDVDNEDIKNLEKYFYEILLYLFKFSICDDYDYLLFYLIILYINDGGVSSVLQLMHNEEKKKIEDTTNIIQCIMLYVRNKEIIENLNQDNFFIQYPKFMSNLEDIKNVISCRNKSLSDDIVNYINNTKRVYKTGDKYDLFMLSDFTLYNIPDNASPAGTGNWVGTGLSGQVGTGLSGQVGTGLSGQVGTGLSGQVASNSLDMRDSSLSSISTGSATLDFPGKGTILNDFNGNIKVIPTCISVPHLPYKQMNISELQKKLIAMKIIRKIVKKYKNNDYVTKYDLKIILTHIEFPITLYFIYLYLKFAQCNSYLMDKLNNEMDGNKNSILAITHGADAHNETYSHMSRCFLAMNYILQNMYVFLKIFYSIISIDLPEYYEDNFEIFFNIFNNILLYDNAMIRNFHNHMDALYKRGKPANAVSSGIGSGIGSGMSAYGSGSPPGQSHLSEPNCVNNLGSNNLSRGKNISKGELNAEDLNKISAIFSQNILKCKVMLVDVIKIISESYQDESKKYIVKLIFSLTQVLYTENDKNLLCHNYNCLASTIKLIHHMNLNKNESNPYKDKEFLHKILERVLHHIRLKRIDIEEILDADLDYFRNDLNKINSFSVRSTATCFLKTLCDNYFDVCFPMLEMRILSKDSLMLGSGTVGGIQMGGAVGAQMHTQFNNAQQNMNTSDNNQHAVVIDKNDPFYEACNIEYKIQLITCLGQVNLALNFYEQNVQHMLKEFVMTVGMKYPDVESICYNIDDYDFASVHMGNAAINMNSNANSASNTHMNSGSRNNAGGGAAGSSGSSTTTCNNKCVWLSNEELFNNTNTIYLLAILKFILNNRNICTSSNRNALDVFAFLYNLLFSEKVMIHSYACLCINRILNQQISNELSESIFSTCIMKILNRLLFLLKYHIHMRVLNEYILITIMRIFIIFSEKLENLYVTVLLILDNTIKTIINDSHNPLFNHYLFELLTIVISLIYKSHNVRSINQVEEIIICTFSQILQVYIHDFIPYIFQILSIIIDNTSTIQKVHIKILTNLYEMDLWKSTVGNANGIICVLQSYFKKYHLFQEIIKNNMQQLFNIYHYCLSNKKISTDSFQIVLIIFTYLPLESYKTYLKPLFVLLFTFIQQYKNDIIKIKVVHTLSILVLKIDVTLFIDIVEQIHTGLIFNILKNLYMPILDKLINVNEKIIIFLALTKLISNNKIREEPFVVDILNLLNQNITNNELVLKKNKIHVQDVQKDEIDKNFEVTYVKLQMINNDNINETVLRNININLELKQNLYNSTFMQICHTHGFNSILQLFNT
ncbi:hypothetical protein, conserved [Plasmodium gonderi]|uniref:Exportin-2 C-terminal domain-containing protein n=1 Tax=Plasmodium gonderi TaxID=77519 RepID=A0A1Y1JIW8_PLAGO|nr:hypothetical protein, conserved [Plasmodium gonderi]GAW80393.1 hypothetical protein, conserved [Plasmodium gonderi]